MALKKSEKENIIKEYATHEGDTGSPNSSFNRKNFWINRTFKS